MQVVDSHTCRQNTQTFKQQNSEQNSEPSLADSSTPVPSWSSSSCPCPQSALFITLQACSFLGLGPGYCLLKHHCCPEMFERQRGLLKTGVVLLSIDLIALTVPCCCVELTHACWEHPLAPHLHCGLRTGFAFSATWPWLVSLWAMVIEGCPDRIP